MSQDYPRSKIHRSSFATLYPSMLIVWLWMLIYRVWRILWAEVKTGTRKNYRGIKNPPAARRVIYYLRIPSSKDTLIVMTDDRLQKENYSTFSIFHLPSFIPMYLPRKEAKTVEKHSRSKQCSFVPSDKLSREGSVCQKTCCGIGAGSTASGLTFSAAKISSALGSSSRHNSTAAARNAT